MTDLEFLAAFESAAIPSDRWAHRDHVRVAFLYLRDLPFDDALARIRSGIRRLNRANGVTDGPTSGYHETVTVAWARLVADAIPAGCATDFEAFAQSNPALLAKERLREHYSKPRLTAAEARSSFVEPDISPLPRAR
jgi:hypothetical protein